MRLTKEKLLTFWNNRQMIFDANQDIVERFNEIKALFEQIRNCSYDESDVITINGTEVKFQGGGKPSLSYFGCKDDEMTASGGFNGVINQAREFPQVFRDLILNIGCMLGGFDFTHNTWMRAEYRIISNSVTNGNDNSTLDSEGQVRHPSSHLADNTYFFYVIKTIQDVANGSFNPEESHIVLRWPNTTYYSKNPDEAKTAQIKTLKTRFPYKFFYMWTHDVLHPVGLLSYRALVQQSNDDFSYRPDFSMNQDYHQFIDEHGWKEYSSKTESYIPEDKKGNDFLNQLSLLLSILMINNQSMVNMEELLRIGNKALILYGPPGTGKTFHAEKLIRKQLDISENEMEDYKYVKGQPTKEKGAWILIQFHPNYTYEDFIGGISPKLDSNSLSYTLKEGIFK